MAPTKPQLTTGRPCMSFFRESQFWKVWLPTKTMEPAAGLEPKTDRSLFLPWTAATAPTSGDTACLATSFPMGLNRGAQPLPPPPLIRPARLRCMVKRIRPPVIE